MRGSTCALMTAPVIPNNVTQNNVTAHKTINRYIHPLEVLGYIRGCQTNGQGVALCIVTGTEGGSVRAPGAMMAVSESGEMGGYMSNGCVDADLALQAQKAIVDGDIRHIRYGANSPFKDIRLPCGGGIEIMIVPRPNMRSVQAAIDALERRSPSTLHISRNGDMSLSGDLQPARWAGHAFQAPLRPTLRLRIAGQGMEVLALADMARAAHCDITLESADPLCLDYARQNHLPYQKLKTAEAIEMGIKDDPFTAFVILFHDHDWDGPLLKQALAGPAFYIGAMGSRAAHVKRCERLTDMGVSAREIAKIHAPIGLIPASRDASVLAVSIMAEIIDVWGRQSSEKNGHYES